MALESLLLACFLCDQDNTQGWCLLICLSTNLFPTSQMGPHATEAHEWTGVCDASLAQLPPLFLS